jgi:hypothetical protein
MYSVYEGDALEDDIAKGNGGDDVDLVVGGGLGFSWCVKLLF